MKVTSLSLIAVAALALNACAKARENIQHEADKKVAAAQAFGKWSSTCKKEAALAIVGIKSQQTVYDFQTASGTTGKTTQLFSDDNCQKVVGQATYTGTASFGNPTGPQDSLILDLNYTNLSIVINDADVASALNKPLVPSCGISDWAVNVPRDVTQVAGQPNCPFFKPAEQFDVVKTDGKTMHFGAADAGHDKTTKDRRPIALDTQDGYTKK